MFFPESTNSWQFTTTVTKTAKLNQKQEFLPINPFEINKTFLSPFLALGVIIPEARNTWRYGGKIAQNFDFSNYHLNYTNKGKAYYNFSNLFINTVNLIYFPFIVQQYRISYFPAKYFTKVILQIWEYTGQIKNENQIILDNIANLEEKINILLPEPEPEPESESESEPEPEIITN